jgi:pimeloyl-ACP methyl ester carboxylesterase
MSNAAAWTREVATWANEFRVYAVDIIGDAGLSAPSRPSFATDAHALWLGDVLDGLGLPRASLVGHSMGGGIALDFAVRFPERVDALVLLCPAGVANKSIMWWALPLLLLGPWGAERVQERLVGRLPAPESEEARGFAALSEAIFEGMRPRAESFDTFTDEDLGRLSMPVLVLLGDRDVTMDSGQIERRFGEHVPDAEVVVYPEKRHYLGDQSVHIARFVRGALAAGHRDRVEP